MTGFWYFSFNTLKIFHCALISITYGKRSVEFLIPLSNVPFLCLLSKFLPYSNVLVSPLPHYFSFLWVCRASQIPKSMFFTKFRKFFFVVIISLAFSCQILPDIGLFYIFPEALVIFPQYIFFLWFRLDNSECTLLKFTDFLILYY